MDWPTVVRLLVFAVVAVVMFVWPRDMRRHWGDWQPRAKWVTIGAFCAFAGTAFGLLLSASTGRPLLPGIWPVLGGYIICAFCLICAPKNED